MENSNEKTIGDVLFFYKQILNYIITKWKIIVVISVLTGVAGITYAYFQKNKYTAQLNFVTESKSGGGLSSYASIASQFGIDLGTGGSGMFEGENLIELIKSDKLVSKTLVQPFNEKETFISYYINDYKLLKKNMVMPNFVNYDGQVKNWLADSLINVVTNSILKNNLSVEKFDKKLDFVFIKFTFSNQQYAKLFVEQLAKNTIDFYIDYKSKKHRANVELLQHQADSVRGLLFGGITDMASTNDLNVNPLKQVVRATTQKKGIDVQVNTAVYSELQKNLQLARLMMLKETPVIKIIDTPRLPLKNLKWGRMLTGLLFMFFGGSICVVYFAAKYFITKDK
jgi:hypothetical protein